MVTPGASSGTSTMLCWRCGEASASVLPITIATLHRGEAVPRPAARGLGLQILEDLGMVVGITGGPDLLAIHRLGRVDVPIHEVEQVGPQLLDARAVAEVHGCALLPRFRLRAL